MLSHVSELGDTISGLFGSKEGPDFTAQVGTRPGWVTHVYFIIITDKPCVVF